MKNELSIDILEKEIISNCEIKEFLIPYHDYKNTIDVIYKMRMKRTPEKKEELNTSNPENMIAKFLKLQEDLKTAKEEREYFEKSVQNLTGAIEQNNRRYDKLLQDYEKLNEIYQSVLDSKKKSDKRVLELIDQRDYAEKMIVEKALIFNKMQDDLNIRILKMNKEKKFLEREKKELNKNKLKIKQNYNPKTNFIKHKSLSSNSQIFDQDEFLEIKLGFKKENTFNLHDKVGKNKSIYNIIAINVDEQQRLIATAGMDQKLIISDATKNMKEIWSFKTKSIINNLCFIEKKNLLCTGAQNNDVDVYDIKRQKLLTKFKNHSDSVNIVEEGDDFTLISASQDRTIKIWDLKKNSLKSTFMFGSSILSLQTNSSIIYSGHFNGDLRIASGKSKKIIFEEKLFPQGQIHFCKFMPSLNSLFLGGMGKQFKIFDLRMMEVSKSFSFEQDDIMDNKKLSFGVDGALSKLFMGTNSGEINYYEIIGNTTKKEKTFKVCNSPIPFVLNLSLHDSLICADFGGIIHKVKIVNEL